ncbi:protein EXECUTER 1, chloroplastic-like [Nicotiana tabacum]|uniref:Protein EXECUTER 1, chloroplastic-like n=1 Tax=Nicotiana tabacum TaxID=4097 RepID=A0A1S4CPF1_TOBAC|nr:PREDICTED: protein EXECUTER 1, chloroplastic-like [Nicotiana tabacum]
MASIAPPPTFDVNTHKFNFSNPKFTSRLKRSSSSFTSQAFSTAHSVSRVSGSAFCCRCRNGTGDGETAEPSPSASSQNSSSSSSWRWDLAFQDAVRNAMKKFDDYVNWSKGAELAERSSAEKEVCVDGEEWGWERWKKHFTEVEEEERLVSVLKSQLAHAISREDYEDAAKLKVGIAAAATKDIVGRVMSRLNKAVEEEQYKDAIFMRDYAGTGLVGWWAGTSEDVNDPYGRIIRISAEHGRYVAKSYSPRQLASAVEGAPLFEIFLTVDDKGEYRQQAVYLKRKPVQQDLPIPSSKLPGAISNLDTLSPTENKSDMFDKISDAEEDAEDRDDEFGFQNALRDMIPGVQVKVLKVTAPGKVDRDLISKVIEQIMDEEDEDEEKDFDLDSMDDEDEIKVEKDGEQNVIELDTDNGVSDGEEQSQIAVRVVVGGLMQNTSSGVQHKDLFRVPARLEKKGHLSFTFSIEEDENKRNSSGSGQFPPDKKARLQGQRSLDHVMLDLAKFIGKGKIPMKVLKDMGELISLTLTQARNRQPLSKSTTFNRIEISASTDPLNGLYIGAHGLYTSEVIHLRRRFGQWKEEGSPKESSRLEFYEYVEAVKLTGDSYVPAGQIAFRARIGKKYQLPHKGIIPEEFGVIARYRGQGRLAEPGFRKPRWVDGELVILDGKYIKGGPVVGFVYWDPEYHFLVFFHRLRLQE